MYASAYDFWRDLLIQFGSNAKPVALSYLDTITAQKRIHGEDLEELSFCKDLYSIISTNHSE